MSLGAAIAGFVFGIIATLIVQSLLKKKAEPSPGDTASHETDHDTVEDNNDQLQ